MFVQEKIEKLKQDWTDQYVIVTGDRPELRRFEGYTGLVKTVNMSGRALVQFEAWSNIGWYDIELPYLHVVPKPDPALAGKRAESAKPATPTEAKAAAPAPKAAGGKMSTADILAASRAKKTPGESAAETPVAEAAVAEKPKAAKPAAKPADRTVLTNGQRPTVEQMLAYCREHDAKG